MTLAFSLVRDMFSMVGRSKCKVFSVIELIDAFPSLRLTEESKKNCGGYYHILVAVLIYTAEYQWD